MKKLMFIFGFLLLTVSLVYAVQIDSVSFDLNGEKLIVSGSKGEILNHAFGDSLLSYEYILETPYFELSGYDGVIDMEKSKGLRSLPKKDFTAEAFTKFPFFSQKNNTVGLLIGSAGASGGSRQDVYFINTQTGSFIKIQLTDMQEITWITENGQLIGYKEYDTSFSLGAHATSWGYKARISSITFFDEAGNITFDKDALKDVYEREYAKISFSDDEKMLLQENIMSEMEHRSLGRKLIDFVYYGLKIGKQQEVFEFLNTLNLVYAEVPNRMWLKQALNVQGNITDKKLAEKCYERVVSVGKTGIFGAKSTTEWLLSAIALDSDNQKYRDTLVELYRQYWEGVEYNIDAEGWEDFERENLKELQALQQKVEKMVKEYKNENS